METNCNTLHKSKRFQNGDKFERNKVLFCLGQSLVLCSYLWGKHMGCFYVKFWAALWNLIWQAAKSTQPQHYSGMFRKIVGWWQFVIKESLVVFYQWLYANNVYLFAPPVFYVKIPEEDYFLWLIEVASLCWRLILRILKPDLIIFGRTLLIPYKNLSIWISLWKYFQLWRHNLRKL